MRSIKRGITLAVGAVGCGKSEVARCIMAMLASGNRRTLVPCPDNSTADAVTLSIH